MPVRLVPANSGKSIKLDKPVLLVGRGPGCDVILTTSRKVSRIHCLVACVEHQVILRDLGSTNGIWINGIRIEREGRVRAGDQVSFADVEFHLLNVDAHGNVVTSPEPQDSAGPRDNNGQQDTRRRAAVASEKPVHRPLEPGQAVPVPIPDESADFAVEESMPRLPRVRLNEPVGAGDQPARQQESKQSARKRQDAQRDDSSDDSSDDSEPYLPDPEDMRIDSRFLDRRSLQAKPVSKSEPELEFEDAHHEPIDDPLGLNFESLEIEGFEQPEDDSGDSLPNLFPRGAGSKGSGDDVIPLGEIDD